MLTTTQFNNARAVSTRPVKLIRWEHSGALELLSGSGDISLDGELYEPGGFFTVSTEDGRTGSLTMPATPARVAECYSGNWRNGKICQIYSVPGLPSDDGLYTLAEAILELDGIIDSSSASGGILTVSAVHWSLRGNITPRTSCNEFSQLIPAANTLVEWEGQSYVLVARR